VSDRRDLVPEQVPVEDISDGPREHLALQMAEPQRALLPGPVARHGLHPRVQHVVAAVTHPAVLLSTAANRGQRLSQLVLVSTVDLATNRGQCST
jgi:hypothetical protein